MQANLTRETHFSVNSKAIASKFQENLKQTVHLIRYEQYYYIVNTCHINMLNQHYQFSFAINPLEAGDFYDDLIVTQ